MDRNSQHRGYVRASGAYENGNEAAPSARYANHRQASDNIRDPLQYWQPHGEYNLHSQQNRGLEIRIARHPSLESPVNRNPQGSGGGVPGTPSWNQVPSSHNELTGAELQPTPYNHRNRDRRDISSVDPRTKVGAETLSNNAYPRHYIHLASTTQHPSQQTMPMNAPSQGPWGAMVPAGFGPQSSIQSRSENLVTVDNQQRHRLLDKETMNLPVDPRYITPAPQPLQTMTGGPPIGEGFSLNIISPAGHDSYPGNWQEMYGQAEAQTLPGTHGSGDPFGLVQATAPRLEPEFSLVGPSVDPEPDESHLPLPSEEQPSPDQSSPSPSADAQSAPTVLCCPKEGCDSIFKGDYRRGNLARHIRVQHGGRQGTPRSFPCEEVGCSSTFRRKDARLKHYRKTHPERLETPPLRRK